MNITYHIEWDVRAYRELKAIENKQAIIILNGVSKLTQDPLKNSKPLSGTFKGKYRLRVGDYRVLFWVNDKEKTVYVIAVGHRRDIYE